MRRRQPEGAEAKRAAAVTEEAVAFWTRYPSLKPRPTLQAEIDEWTAEYHAFCEEHGLEVSDVDDAAARRGLTDQPFRSEWAL